MKALLTLKFFLWGMVIFIFSSLLSSFHGCEEWELKFTRLASPPYTWQGLPEKDSKDVNILTIEFYDNNATRYLQTCLRVAEDLKKVGAKVILVPFPQNLPITKEHLELIVKIQRSGNVIFGSAPRQDPVEKSFSRLKSSSWWTEQPVFHRADIDWGASTASAESYPTFFEFVPYAVREAHSGDLIPDVSLQVVKKYYRGPDTAEIIRGTNYVSVRQHSIPLWGDGVGYIKPSFRPSWLRQMSAEHIDDGGKVMYVKHLGGQEIRGDSLLINYKDKITVINWFFVFSGGATWPGYGDRYWSIIDSILSDRFVTRHDEWDMLLVVLFVVVSAVLIYRVRSSVAIILLLLLSGSMLYLSVWLFSFHDTMLDPLYPLMTLALSILVFPIVKVTHEKRTLEEEMKSLQAEMNRLREESKVL